MSTNYYLVGPRCSHCRRYDDWTRRHIGKRHGIGNFQYAFTFQTNPGDGLYSVTDWVDYLSGNPDNVVDEYETTIISEDLLDLIDRASELRLLEVDFT